MSRIFCKKLYSSIFLRVIDKKRLTEETICAYSILVFNIAGVYRTRDKTDNLR